LTGKSIEKMETTAKHGLSGRERQLWQKIAYTEEVCRVARGLYLEGVRNYEAMNIVLRIYGYDFHRQQIADVFRLQNTELLNALKHCLKELENKVAAAAGHGGPMESLFETEETETA